MSIRTTASSRSQSAREVQSRSSNKASSNSRIVEFELGKATKVTKLQVFWPNGITYTKDNITTVDRAILVGQIDIYPHGGIGSSDLY